jgi:hypothetical protein
MLITGEVNKEEEETGVVRIQESLKYIGVKYNKMSLISCGLLI